jgi:TonB family protein
MKNLLKLLPVFLLFLVVGLACKNNPFTQFSKQYNCVVTGETEPRSAEDFIKRGGYHFNRKEYQCYVDACSEAVRLEPKNAKAISCRGSGYFFQKDYDKAIADQTKAIEIDPTDRMFYSRRGAAYEEKKLYSEALADYEKSLELSESDRHKSFSLESIANLLYEKGEPDAALTRIDEAIKLVDDDYWNYKTRAKIYKKLGKNDLAEADEQKAKELDADKKDKTTSESADTPQPSGSNQNAVPTNSVSGGVLNGKATSLPKPAYPPAAKAVRASGAVNVQVVVDEKGNVTSASAVSGHPLLRSAAEQAAKQAKFSPTLLSGKPVKVSGILVYNFTAE